MIKIIATLCSLAAPTECHDETVATMATATRIEAQGCQIGMPALAEWMRSYPDYRLKSWRCFISEKREGI